MRFRGSFVMLCCHVNDVCACACCCCCCFFVIFRFFMVCCCIHRVVLSCCQIAVCSVQIRRSSHTKEETLNVKPARNVLHLSFCMRRCVFLWWNRRFSNIQWLWINRCLLHSNTDRRTYVRTPDRTAPLCAFPSAFLVRIHTLAYGRIDKQLFWQCSTKRLRSGFVGCCFFLAFQCGGNGDVCCMLQTHFLKKQWYTDILLILFEKVLHWMVPIPANYFKLTHLRFALNSKQSQSISKNTLFFTSFNKIIIIVIMIIPYK